MKIVSQNTTALSSATAPGNNQPQLVATPVPDEQRISFWPQHFGLIPQWVTLEPRVFGWMELPSSPAMRSRRHIWMRRGS